MKKITPQIGDRFLFASEPNTTCGVAVEIDENVENGIKIHWHDAPKEKGSHRNGRGSYNIKQLKLARV